MKQLEVARIFSHMADLLEFRGENPFRIRAYRKAAQNLESLSQDLEDVARQGRLTEIPGIGADLAGKITEYLAHGIVKDFERLKRTVPPGIFQLLEIPGVGPKTTKLLYERLRIRSIDQLERAAKAHRLCRLPGIQEQKEQNILKGIAIVKKGLERMHLGTALPLSEAIVGYLKGCRGTRRVAVAGSLRRMRETIGDLDILVTTTKPEGVMKAFTTAPFCDRILAAGTTKSSILTPQRVQVDLRVVEPACFGAALQYFTGSKEHNVHLRELAARKGLKINEYGVFRTTTGRRVGGREEEEVYRTVGLPWIPPEIREDTGEIEAAIAKKLPRLVELKEIRGDFHIHTNQTDGAHPLQDVAAALKQRGYEYAAICDHSRSLRVARGMSIPQLKAQGKAIRALNRNVKGFRLLAGSEVDILEDGTLDYPDEVLRELDFVVGSVHSHFGQDRATMTARIIRAIRNPYVTLIAHPTGRLMGQREPYAVDLDAVFRAAKEHHTALEINAYPKRLDLNDGAARRAKELGAMLAISTDTHSLDQLEQMAIGVGIARRAWLGPQRLLNCASLGSLMTWIAQKRSSGSTTPRG